MRQRRIPKNLKAVVLCLTICSGMMLTAYAAGGRTFNVRLPGVDRWGNLDHSLGGHGRVKITCDTHRRTFCATAHGTVRNLSHWKQTFHGHFSVPLRQLALRLNLDPSRVVITKDIYTVEKPRLFHHHSAPARAVVCGHLNGVVNGAE